MAGRHSATIVTSPKRQYTLNLARFRSAIASGRSSLSPPQPKMQFIPVPNSITKSNPIPNSVCGAFFDEL